MARKPARDMSQIAQAQQETEKINKTKFEENEYLAHAEKAVKAPTTAGRTSPQISCTVLPEDRQLLNELTLYASNKAGKILNTSVIIRALIRLGHKRKDELEL